MFRNETKREDEATQGQPLESPERVGTLPVKLTGRRGQKKAAPVYHKVFSFACLS